MALTKWQTPTARHDIDDDGRVSWLELFFDLIYVAALIQLGDRLASDVSWRGGLVFAGAFILLWWTWTGTTAVNNRFAVDDITHRLLTFLQMGAVGNLALLAATTPENWRTWLPLAYVGARLPLIAMYFRARKHIPEAREFTGLAIGFFSVGAALFVASILFPESQRPAVWVVALLVELVAPAVTAKKGYGPPIHDEHFEERSALFTIIVLGETFVKSLSEVANIGISTQTQTFGAFGFMILIAIWWTYFDDVAGSHIRTTSALTKWAPGNRLIWVYVHLPLTAGITAFGVAVKKVIGVETFGESLKDNYTWLLVIALIVVLLSVAVLDMVTASPHYSVEAPVRVGPRLAAVAALVPLGFLIAAGTVSALTGVVLIAAVMVVQIGVEVLSAQKSEYRLNREVQSAIDDQAGECEHLHRAVAPGSIPSPRVCHHCEEHGTHSVQLRWCLTCGEVGCCDDTEGQYARRHYEQTGHPVIATIEPGDTWAYCYLHDRSAPNWWLDHASASRP